jgi:4-hydroxy-tetrahydrodipicolinate reductase
MDIILNGANGRMGRVITKKVNDGYNGVNIVAAVDRNGAQYESLAAFTGKGDVIIDFSNHAATKELLDYAVSHNTPVVIATTGQNEEEKEMIVAASKKIPVFFSYNMSLGIAALSELAKKAASLMKDAEIEIVEIHHDQKLDAPSGTALLLADSIKEVRPDSNLVIGRNGHAKREKNDIGISSIRIGNVVGVHEIIISSGLETLTLKHEAHDRSLFADGALVAAEYLSKVNQPGLYNMKDLVK